jgi:hypothetical protein
MNRFRRTETRAKPPAAPVGTLPPFVAPFAALPPPVIPDAAEPAPVVLRMRLAPGIHAVTAAEAEIMIDGTRIAGGGGIIEFNLWVEAWVDIRIVRAAAA